MAKSKKGKQRAQPQNVEDEPLDTITEAAHEEGGQWQTEETDPDAWNQPVPGGWGETRHPVSPALSATRPPGAWDHTQPPAPWPGASPTPPPPPLPPPAGGDPWNLPPPVPPSTINKPPSRRSSSHRHTSRSTRAPGGKGSHFASWQTWAAEAAGAPAKPAEPSVTAPYAGGWGESAPQASVRPTGGGGGGWESWAREDHSKREQGWAAPTQEVNTGGGWNTQDSGGWDTQNSSGWDNQANGDWDDYNEANDSSWPAGGGGDDTYGGWEGGGEGGGHGQGGDDSWGAPTAAKDGWQSWAKQADHAKPGVPATPRTRNISTSSRPSSRTMAFATNRVSATSTIPWQSSTSSSSKGMDIYNAGGFALSDGEVVESLQRPLFNHERLAKDRLLWLFPRAKDKRVSFILQWIISMEYGLAALALDAFLGGNERGALIVNAATFSTHNPMFDWITHEDAVATRDKRLQESIGFYEPVKHAIVFVFLPSASGNSAAVWRQKVEVPESAQAENRRAVHSSPRSAWKKQVYVDEILPSMKVPKKKKGFFRRIFRIFKIFKVDW